MSAVSSWGRQSFGEADFLKNDRRSFDGISTAGVILERLLEASIAKYSFVRADAILGAACFERASEHMLRESRLQLSSFAAAELAKHRVDGEEWQ